VGEEKVLKLAVPTIEGKVRMFQMHPDQEGIVVKNVKSNYPVGLTRCLENRQWYKVKHKR
jgi:hypothetical protein